MSLKLPSWPRFLESQGHGITAQKTLARLRKTAEPRRGFPREYEAIEQDIALEHSRAQEQQGTERNGIFKAMISSWVEFWGITYRKRVFQGVLLMSMQPFVGFSVLRHHAVVRDWCIDMGRSYDLWHYCFQNHIRLVGLVICYLTIDRWGRRPLLLYGSALMSIILFLTAGLAYIARDYQCGDGMQLKRWLGTGLYSLSYLVLSMTWGTVSLVLAAEIFPNRLRAKGFAMSVCGSSL
jgi:hypothetical protein